MSGHEIDKLTQIYFDFFIYLFVIVVFLYIIKLTELDKSVKLITWFLYIFFCFFNNITLNIFFFLH